jgi:hypothetical protein
MSVIELLKCIDMNMVEKYVVTFGFNNDNLKKNLTLVIQQPCGKLSIRPHHQRPRGSNKKQMVLIHHTPLNKGEKTSVGGVMEHIENKIVLIPFKPPLPTLTLTNHVPIVIHMGMMQIIISYCIQNFGRPDHKLLMPIKPKVL